MRFCTFAGEGGPHPPCRSLNPLFFRCRFAMSFRPRFGFPFAPKLGQNRHVFSDRFFDHLFNSFYVNSGSISDVFLMDFGPSEGNKRENAKTLKTIKNQRFLIVFHDPTIARFKENVGFLFVFLWIRFWDAFFIDFGHLFTIF